MLDFETAYTRVRSRSIVVDGVLRPSTAVTRVLSPVHTSNNVQATFDFVERIVRLVSFDNVVRHRCWCGRGFTDVTRALRPQ